MKRIQRWTCMVIGLLLLVSLSALDTAASDARQDASEFWEKWGDAVSLAGKSTTLSLPAAKFVECIIYGEIEKVQVGCDPELGRICGNYTKYEIQIEQSLYGRARGTIDVYTLGSLGVFRGGIGATKEVEPYYSFIPTGGHVLLVAVRWPHDGPRDKPWGPATSLRNKLWIGAAFVPLDDGVDVGFVDRVDWSQVKAEDIKKGILPPEAGTPITTSLGLSVQELSHKLTLLFGE